MVRGATGAGGRSVIDLSSTSHRYNRFMKSLVLTKTMVLPPHSRRPFLWSLGLALAVTSCSASARTTREASSEPSRLRAEVRGAPRGELRWAEFSAETFARAKAENRYVVLDGSAEWCHWCHVMESETYHDPAVRKILEASFIAAKVDVDSRPDIEERYGDYGWPATVIFSPDGVELGKYRGFLDASRFIDILNRVVASKLDHPAQPLAGSAPESSKVTLPPMSEEHLAWIQHAVEVELNEYWDPVNGGWGRNQKAPMGWNNAWMLNRAALGDVEARQRVLFTLDQQAQLIDPVWGGMYQYSTGGNWRSPHFEKLMTYQAPALDNYARAYQLTGDPLQLARARALQSYLERFLRGANGGFLASQDADLHAHDSTHPFMTGHDYYAKGEADRLALGVPRVDDHEYGRDNGLAIGAYATLYEVTQDAAVRGVAEAAVRRVLDTHLDARGGITHDLRKTVPKGEVLYLSDNAAFGFGLVRLYEATGVQEYLRRAQTIAAFLVSEMRDHASGAFFAHTLDPAGFGVFAVRRIPFEDNVMALRFLAHLAQAAPSVVLSRTIDGMVRALARPELYKARGRILGDFLLALEETRGVRGDRAAGVAVPGR